MRWALVLALALLGASASGAPANIPFSPTTGCQAQHGAAFCRAVENRHALRVIRRMQVREVARTHVKFKRAWYRGWDVKRLAAANRWERSRLRHLQSLPTWWPTDPVALGKLMAAQEGWTGDEWGCLFQVVDHESGWKVTAWNRQSGAGDPAGDPYGAYGLPQSHPPSKLASAGPDWRTSGRTQLRWLIGYIKARRWEGIASSLQRTPCGAWAHWRLYLRGGASYSY